MTLPLITWKSRILRPRPIRVYCEACPVLPSFGATREWCRNHAAATGHTVHYVIESHTVYEQATR